MDLIKPFDKESGQSGDYSLIKSQGALFLSQVICEYRVNAKYEHFIQSLIIPNYNFSSSLLFT